MNSEEIAEQLGDALLNVESVMIGFKMGCPECRYQHLTNHSDGIKDHYNHCNLKKALVAWRKYEKSNIFNLVDDTNAIRALSTLLKIPGVPDMTIRQIFDKLLKMMKEEPV